MPFGIQALRNAIGGFKPAIQNEPPQKAGAFVTLSPHFSLAELTVSQTAARKGLSNNPPPAIIANMRVMAAGMEQVRALLGVPIHVNSGYRAPAVNAAVGGSTTSAHCKGWACDFIAPAFGDPLAVCRAIEASGIVFDQLIFEHTWTHVSFDPLRRRQLLTLRKSGGYAPGIVPGA